jgi:aminoglycoside phosphotransferase (APT) family kinase protein
VAVPRVLFEDLGKPPEIPPFFAMTFVEGESLEPHIDAVDSLPPAGHIEARAFAAARMLAALHASAPDEIGLGGEPEVTTLEEIERWVRAFATVDDEFKRGTDDCAALLRKSMPDRIAPAIVHGDWRLGNMLCRGPELRAVIDWEIWARSDPRIDLAWYLLTASPAEHPSAKRDAPGMPRPDVLLAEYRAAGGAPADDINWFTALVLFKMAAVLALIVKNHRKRGDPHGYAAQVVPQIPIMVDRATAMLG